MLDVGGVDVYDERFVMDKTHEAAIGLEEELRSVLLDEAGCIAKDLDCLGCGYNLRTMESSGVCPECGTEVMRSIRGGFLKYATPQWVQSLASGMDWVWYAVVAFLLQFQYKSRKILDYERREVGLGFLRIYFLVL